MSQQRIASGFTLLLFLAGCQVGVYEDASARPEVAKAIGQGFVLNQELIAIGVTLDQNYRGGVDMIHLVLQPGFSGPEVKASEKISAGTQVRISGALTLRTTFNEKLYFVLEGLNCHFCRNAKVIVRASGAELPPHFRRSQPVMTPK